MTVAVCAAVILAMIAASFIANRRLPPADRLPMQWGVSGRPTWSAPRLAALSFMPALAVVTIAVIYVASGGALPGGAVVIVAFLAAHLLHLWMIGRQLGQA
ncbi:DUF1648 domain-containing protein [Pseudoroseicyclus tamaricis]|uniref:DUF1648 domain-containing protein n=1 Tax=Pseudoroseicyclus tamaricis TaxID=2705421 RepID=A0A6B2JKI0_9RHOB|nr:DUF1648 domain-containing protein [Pseudoroseicyclus tamaricis]NDV01983.1 hypothetical protein [Pseudoroseicyclus tamaricis]